VKYVLFHRAGKRLKKGCVEGPPLRTSPAGTGERCLEEGHGSAVPLLTNGACITNAAPIDEEIQKGYNLFIIGPTLLSI
jgi:hypothetical protein